MVQPKRVAHRLKVFNIYRSCFHDGPAIQERSSRPNNGCLAIHEAPFPKRTYLARFGFRWLLVTTTGDQRVLPKDRKGCHHRHNRPFISLPSHLTLLWPRLLFPATTMHSTSSPSSNGPRRPAGWNADCDDTPSLAADTI